MLKARLTLDKDFVTGDVDPRLFGGFIEHMGRCIYEALYEPDHPCADEEGFRTDVMDLVREMAVPVVRYPGGNFVSSYDWEDGIGPKEARPRRLNLAWMLTETNQFGTNEFVSWCQKVKTDPMIAVNLGTRGIDAARNLVEYCNHPRGTYWSDLRKTHGYDDPYGIKLWCLGNELDSIMQIGHKTPVEYGRLAREAAKVMKRIDPSIELVLNGSCSRHLPKYITWDAEALDITFDDVDYLSIHTYHYNRGIETADYLAQSEIMARFIEEIVAACDYVAAKRKSPKRIMISFDEWNALPDAQVNAGWKEEYRWTEAPPTFEAAYRMEDALAVGTMLTTLLNHCDRVKIACFSELTNVAGAIMTRKGGPAWRQTTFYPFAQASRYGRGKVLRQVVDSPIYESEKFGEATYLNCASVLNPETEVLTLFAVNRSIEDDLELTVDLRAFGELKLDAWHVMRDDDLDACNTCEDPDNVKPTEVAADAMKGSTLSVRLSPASWNVIRLAPVRP